jgi:hypothetical protein
MMIGVREIKALMIVGVLSFCCGASLVACDGSNLAVPGQDSYELPSEPKDTIYLEYELKYLKWNYSGQDWVRWVLKNLCDYQQYSGERSLIFADIAAVGLDKLSVLLVEQRKFITWFFGLLRQNQGTRLCKQFLIFAQNKEYNIRSMIKAWPAFIIKLKTSA